MKSNISNQQPTNEILTTIQFARKIRKTSHAVRQYIENGMPVYERGGKGIANKIDLAAAWDWALKGNQERQPGRPANQNPVDEAKARSAAALAEKHEFELAQRRGEYVLIRDVCAIAADEMIEARSILTAIVPEAHEQFGADLSGWLESRIAAAFDKIVTAKQPFDPSRIDR